MNVAIFLLCFHLTLVYSALPRNAENCDSEQCTLANNCHCSSTASPLVDGDSPQLISLTFDESVVNDLYQSVWEPLLFNRQNPDGNNIGVTFFVPHEYTDYSKVQALYVQGFEIGVNSITKNSLAEYWSTAGRETLIQEFQGQRTIISTFANIPLEDIIGVRTPQLQFEGDVSVDAYVASGLQYDSSWTSRSTAMYFPYTLDYLSNQECRIGTTCPVESHPGFWIAPIIDLQGNSTDDGTVLECNALTTCNVQGSADDIASWLLGQVERERSTEKAPMTLMVPSAWFRFTANSFEGFQKFLDGLQELDDVFLVTQKQVIEWSKNPVPVDQFQTDVFDRAIDCLNISCPLRNEQDEVRYMMSCIPCPEVYPWLGNPLGQLNPTTPPSTITTPTQSTTTPTTTTIVDTPSTPTPVTTDTTTITTTDNETPATTLSDS